MQNPTGTIMPVERRQEMLQLSAAHGVPIFEDDCYADLTWSGERPPALYAMSERGGVIHIGSFSKSIAPALRVGYIVAPWDVMSRMLALKTDGGSGALEQMVLAEYCTRNFSKHVRRCAGLARQARDADGIAREHFGTAAEFDDPAGGIFLWVKLPDSVDTMKLYEPALAAGVAINPGPQWSVNKEHGRSRLRLCFASPSHEEIHQGVAALAEVCRREFGVPANMRKYKSNLLVGTYEACSLDYSVCAQITTSGILMPSALAVLRLMTVSNLFGCSIGRSPGFAPLKILSA